MNQDNLGTLPEDMQPLVERLMMTVHGIMDSQEYLQPVYILVDRKRERMMPLVVPFTGEDSKRAAANMMRKLIYAQPEVDAVIFMCEGWKKEYTRSDPESYNMETPVRDRPGREDIIMILIETYDGTWAANPVVKGEPGEKRTLEPIRFERGTAYEGQMASYLPPRNKKEVN